MLIKKFSSWITLLLRSVVTFDLRSLAFVRIFLGTLLLITFFNYSQYTSSLFSDSGVFPRLLSLKPTSQREFSLFLASGTLWFQYLVFLTGGVAAILFIYGAYERVSLFICWLVFYSISARSTEYSFGLCPAMLGVLFWALFLPWHRAPRSPLVTLEGGAEQLTTHWAAVGLFCLCAAISYGAGLAKYRNYADWFVTYEALRLDFQYYANVNVFTRLMSQLPRSWFGVLSPAVVLVEMGTPLLLLSPILRWLLVPCALVCASLVYFGIAFSIHVGIFPLVTLTGFYLFIPGALWERLAASRIISRISSIVTKVSSVLFHGVIMIGRAFYVKAHYLGIVCALCFVLLVIDAYGPARLMPQTIPTFVNRLSAPLFGFFQVRPKWDWIYGGAIRNRFLIVKLQTPFGSELVNVTHVNYSGVLYNYFMNYSNSILRGKDDTERLFHYAQYFCKGEGEISRPVAFRGTATSVQLFAVEDSDNLHQNLPDRDQQALARAIDTRAPFWSFDCKSSAAEYRRSWQIPSEAIRPGRATDLPVMGWSQDFGVLRINTAVDGNPISLGGSRYDYGFGTHANSRIRLAVKGLRAFRARVALDDEKKASPYGSVIIRIEGDGKELFRSSIITMKTRPIDVDIDIHGVQELSLITEDAGRGLNDNFNCDDHVSWADPVVY